MRLIYSLVVDAAPRFGQQASILVRSLLATGVVAGQIHVHLTPDARARPELVASLTAYGVVLHDLIPFLDRSYCNKLMQLDALPFRDADCVALCDADLAFLTSLETVARTDVVRAKPVDLPNPPLALLEDIRAICGLNGNPRLVRTSCDEAMTWIFNCNGGLYLLPSSLVPAIAASWQRHAITLHAQRQILGRYAHHIDQVSFAMAMLELGLDIHPLPIEDNFPLHLADRFPLNAAIMPRVLHFHGLHEDDDRLLPTGHASLDRAVHMINLRLKQPS